MRCEEDNVLTGGGNIAKTGVSVPRVVKDSDVKLTRSKNLENCLRIGS